MVAVNLLQYCLQLQVISVMLVGHLDELALLLLPLPVSLASVCCLNTASLSYMIPFGLGAAVSTRVSNELGAAHSRAARLAVYVAISMAITEAALMGCTLFSIRNVWGYAFSNEQEVVYYVASMMPLLAASTITDGIQGVLSELWEKGSHMQIRYILIFCKPTF